MSSTLTRAFTVAVSLVTLGVGALVIAFYNKFYYKKFSLANNQSYTGTLVGEVSQTVLESGEKKTGVNISRLFQPAVTCTRVDNKNHQEDSFFHANPMHENQFTQSVMVH